MKKYKDITRDWEYLNRDSNDVHGRYTVVSYKQMESYDLNFAEYHVVNYIHNTSKRTGGKLSTWSKAKPATIARDLGMSERHVYRILKGLIRGGRLDPMLEKNQGSYRVYWNKEWIQARGITQDSDGKKRFTKFNNDVRKKLDLTFLEYAFLKYLDRLIFNSSTTYKTGLRVATVTKQAIANRLGCDRTSITKIVQRLERNNFVEEVTWKENKEVKKGICLLMDMNQEERYAVDVDGDLYLPERTVEIVKDQTAYLN